MNSIRWKVMVTVLMAVIVCSGLYAFYTFSVPPSGKQAREHAEHAGQEAGGGLGPVSYTHLTLPTTERV